MKTIILITLMLSGLVAEPVEFGAGRLGQSFEVPKYTQENNKEMPQIRNFYNPVVEEMRHRELMRGVETVGAKYKRKSYEKYNY